MRQAEPGCWNAAEPFAHRCGRPECGRQLGVIRRDLAEALRREGA